MAARATFTGFDPYKLTGVRVTDRKLGHGSYATVLELEYMGLKCAGKKIHELLLEQGDASYTVRRFEEECRLLSQVRHPNIVQFLGVYFQQGVQAPILVMEFLPTNLTSCIEQYGILPKEISYSILHDVALGLCYLHSQTPPIIHRDLSSSNVLLTPNMTAKISDLGVARIFNKLIPQQVSRMTQTPGTPAYMPPEVMVANPKYNTSVDTFSYGIMMIHMFSGQWPEPQVGPSRIERVKLIPVTEAERREMFFETIEDSHLLMDLIHRCINNDPQLRPHADEIIRQVSRVATQFPASYSNRLEMLKHIKIVEEQTRVLREEKDVVIQQKEMLQQDAEQKADEINRLNVAYSSQIDRLNLAHSSEGEQLKLEVRDLKSQNELLVARHEAEVAEISTEFKVKVAETKAQVAEYKTKIEVSDSMREIAEKRWQQEKELNGRLIKSLQENDSIITGTKEQLTRTREYLTANKQQILQASIIWKECAQLPTELITGKTTVINGKVYCGGGWTDDDDDHDHIIHCYDPSQDKWTTLPPLPVKYFGLGQVNGKLVAIGGWKKSCESAASVYTYDERSRKWKQTIPPMPTARWSPGVLSLQSALVVAGGAAFIYIDTVEIFKPDTSQWYRTDPLPRAGQHKFLVAIGNTCYALGGFGSGSYLNQALYASVDDLLGNAVPANQTTHNGQSAWKILPNTSNYQPAAAVLAGNLLAIGGKEKSEGGADMKEVYMYSPSTNSWIYISDLPAPRAITAVAVLSSTEVLVIGGRDGIKVNTVYKGTLQLV